MSATSFAVKLYDRLPNKKLVHSKPETRAYAEDSSKFGGGVEFEHARYIVFALAAEFNLDMTSYLDGRHTPWELRQVAIKMLSGPTRQAAQTSSSSLPSPATPVKPAVGSPPSYDQKDSASQVMGLKEALKDA